MNKKELRQQFYREEIESKYIDGRDVNKKYIEWLENQVANRNELLNEREIQERINFKLSQFEDYLNNMIGRTLNDSMKNVHPKYAYYHEAFTECKNAFIKEKNLPLPFDDIARSRLRKENEEFTEQLSERLLKRGTRNYHHDRRFIAKLIDQIQSKAIFINDKDSINEEQEEITPYNPPFITRK